MDEIAAAITAVIIVAASGFALLTYTKSNAPPITEPSPGPHPRSFPAKPSNLSNESAARFAAVFEEVRLHNSVLKTNSAVTDVDTACAGTFQNRTATGFHVTVRCGYAWEFREEGGVAIADGAPYTVQYFISPDRTRRFDQHYGP